MIHEHCLCGFITESSSQCNSTFHHQNISTSCEAHGNHQYFWFGEDPRHETVRLYGRAFPKCILGAAWGVHFLLCRIEWSRALVGQRRYGPLSNLYVVFPVARNKEHNNMLCVGESKVSFLFLCFSRLFRSPFFSSEELVTCTPRCGRNYNTWNVYKWSPTEYLGPSWDLLPVNHWYKLWAIIIKANFLHMEGFHRSHRTFGFRDGPKKLFGQQARP